VTRTTLRGAKTADAAASIETRFRQDQGAGHEPAESGPWVTVLTRRKDALYGLTIITKTIT